MPLKNTFNFYLNIFQTKGLFNLFSSLENELNEQYENLFNNQLNSNINLVEEYCFNVITRVSIEAYNVSWSIPKAKRLITENKIKSSTISWNNLYSDTRSLNQEKLRFYQKKDIHTFQPIIVSYYLPIRQYVVIDGNHRLYSHSLRSNDNIRAYILSPFANSIIMNEKSFAFYIFHHNLVNLLNLCCNPLEWNFDSNKSLKWNTFYGNTKFKNVNFKKVKMIIKRPYLPRAK